MLINLFGPPCSGKSTMAAGLFSKLKKAGYTSELITERAKELVWEDRVVQLSNQFSVTAEQYKREERVIRKVQIAITDSPILLGAVYGVPPLYGKEWENFLVGLFNARSQMNFLLSPYTYQDEGRAHLGQEWIIYMKILDLLDRNDIKYKTSNDIDLIYDWIIKNNQGMKI